MAMDKNDAIARCDSRTHPLIPALLPSVVID
ncbi:hypothetical protein SAMN06295879_1204 [Agreia bicolorata]|uniref:Uncharacterized protein n=1 Tax=Agreia bicolorata TaxID=110935 RepID=A0A1T4XJ56_9MICO|nr:hypothetical protein SAMN06295879_1204 [Agreia bicolorata]